MRALVTGAAGFIGSHLCERLLGRGEEVRAVDSFSDYYDPKRKRSNVAPLLGSAGFELIEGDLAGLDLDSLLDGVDVVFHLAGQPGVRASWGEEFSIYLDENVLVTQRLLEAACEHRPKRFVFASSSSIYGDAEQFPTRESDTPRPISPYGVTKLAAENLCRLYWTAFEVPTVALRYFTIFGPRQRPDMAFSRFIDAALNGRPIPVFGDGLQSRDFTYVDDAVAATISAASSGEPGAVYNVAGGTQATVLDVIEVLARLLGVPPEVERQPPMPGDARKTGADTARARRDLGYRPGVSLEEGLSRELDWVRAAADRL